MIRHGKKHFSSAIPALMACLLLSSCAADMAFRRAQAEMEGGNARGAVEYACESLRIDSKNEAVMDYLVALFPRAVAMRLEDAEKAAAGSGAFRYEKVARAYQDIHAMNSAILSLPPLQKKVGPPLSFETRFWRDELAEALALAAAERYEAGMAAEAGGNRASFREAYRHFTTCLQLSPGYMDAESRATEARNYGSDRILVLPPEAVGTGLMGSDFGSLLYGKLLGRLVDEAGTRDFLQIVERSGIEELLREQELSQSALFDGKARPEALGLYGANYIVALQILSLTPGYPEVSTSDFRFDANVDVAIPGAQPVNGVFPTQKERVFAAVTVFRRESSVAAAVSYRAIDIETSIIFASRTIALSAKDSCEWAVITGDTRAVPSEYLRLANNSDRPVKSPEALLASLGGSMADGIADSLLSRIVE